MEKLEKVLKCLNSPDEDDDELINLIGLKETELEHMNQEAIDNALNKRLFDFIDEYGWDNVKQTAKERFPVSYVYLILLSDREEDIPEIKDILLNSEQYEVSPLDMKELIGRIDDLDFLGEVALNANVGKFVKNVAISKIMNNDLSKGREVLKVFDEPCSLELFKQTYEKIDDVELIKLLIDNSRRFSLGAANENVLLRKLYEHDPESAKTYIADILENPTKHCIIKAKIGDYLQSILNNINKVDTEYSAELATQMIDRFKSYGVKIDNISLFMDYVKDPEKVKEYLGKYKDLDLDIQSLKILLEKLSETDKPAAVVCAKKIIDELDKDQIPTKMTCIISCQDSNFIKECIENREKYYLDFDQLCTLIAKVDDPKYIIEKISKANLQASTVYSIIANANNEKLYMHCIKNADSLNLTPEVIYKMMSDRLPLADAIKLLKNAENKQLGNSFKAIFLQKLIEADNPNITGFIKKYIKNYKANKFEEDSLIRILNDSLKPELIQTYLDAKDTPIKETELKLLLYSDRREQILDLIFQGKVPLNEETKKAAIFTAYTIQDTRIRKEILKRLKVDIPETKSKISIPPEMTVGIEIESVGSMSRQVQDLKELILGDWEAKKDGSLSDINGEPGVEVTSPILHGDDPEINNKIAHVANFLINEGQFVNNSCGGHVHIGADYFKDYESYQNLVDLWVNCEQIFYIISNQVGEVPRKNIAEYAKPISKSYEKSIEEGQVDFTEIATLRDIERQLNLASRRCNSLNFNNLSDYEKHTIEFRLPNGTVNPDTWIENINLFGNTLKKCQEITQIRKKDKDALTPEEKSELKVFNSLVFGDLSMDDRAKVLIDFVLPENQQQVFHNRYFVNSKLLNLHNDVKEFLSSETFATPIDITDIKEKLFAQEGRINGVEFAICSTVIQHELQRMKGEINYGS
jgi:hypothetical protein